MQTLEQEKMSKWYQIKGGDLPFFIMKRFDFKPDEYLLIRKATPDEIANYDNEGFPITSENKIKKSTS